MSRPCIIYAIVHIASGKRYVGSTVDRKSRRAHHWSALRGNRHHCPHLQNAWNKYGEDAFEFRILETLETPDKKTRVSAELRAIAEVDCYNSRIAALGLTNFENGPEMRKAIKRTITQKLKTDDGYREVLARIGAAIAAYAKTPEARAKMSKHTKMLWRDKKHRQRVSKKLKVYWETSGIKDAHSIRVKEGKTEITLKRHSDWAKQAWADPKSGLRNRKQTRWTDPAARGRQAQKMRAIWAARRATRNESDQ